MLAMSSKQKITFTLPHYQAWPEAERPMFVAHFLSARESLEFHEITAEALRLTGEAESARKLVAAASLGLTGWRNVRDRDGREIAFDPGCLPDVLTLAELWELPFALMRAQQLTEEDLKNSALPRASAGASAVTAINAPTPPPPPESPPKAPLETATAPC